MPGYLFAMDYPNYTYLLEIGTTRWPIDITLNETVRRRLTSPCPALGQLHLTSGRWLHLASKVKVALDQITGWLHLASNVDIALDQ